MYHHTATESLYFLHGLKISWTPTLARVSYQFTFIYFSTCLQCKISGSSVFSIFFPHKVSHHNLRIIWSQFLKKTSNRLDLESFKKSQSKVFRVLAKILSIEIHFFSSAWKCQYFFWLFVKTTYLQKIWFLSYGRKTWKNQNAGFCKLQYLTKNLRFEVEFLDMTRGPRKH